MKTIIKAAAFILGAVLFSCQTKPDVGIVNNYPPSIVGTSPDGTTKVGNNFDLKVFFVDGPSSPLASVTVTLSDSAGTKVIYTGTKALTGTSDSIVVAGTDFKASTLPLGTYKIVIDAVDKGNNKTEKTVLFKVSQNLYPAKNKAMYLAGVYNNYGADPFTLIGPYTWQIKNIDLKAGQFKFKNTPDWTDQDWGDLNCDGTMEVTTGGKPNTDCKYTGLSIITFYDNTLKYTITPAVTYARTVTNLYLLGSINNFEGSSYNFTLTGDHTWEIAEVRMKAGDQFKFSVGPYGGDSFGDSGTPGVAVDQGPNIVMPATAKDAFYKVDFNDKTLAYTITVVRYPYPDAMYLVGGSTSGGWDNTKAVAFMKTDNGKFEIYAQLSAAGGGFKYIPQTTSFDNDWGPQGADAAAASGTLVETGESNATIAADGFYKINLDFTTNTFTIVATTWGLVGDGTPNGWPGDPPNDKNDTNMTFDGGTTWHADVALTTGAVKFRANKDWGINLGGSAGKLTYGGDNIPSPGPGNYKVTLNLDPVNGYTYTITPE